VQYAVHVLDAELELHDELRGSTVDGRRSLYHRPLAA
jgi:hypothetical protein